MTSFISDFVPEGQYLVLTFFEIELVLIRNAVLNETPFQQ
jgi:hypothetical protein